MVRDFLKISTCQTNDLIHGIALHTHLAPKPRGFDTARSITVRSSSGSNDSSLTTTERLSSGLITEKLGFSVVAAMKVTSRFSTLGNNASCCDLEKRCTSSMNRTVSLP